jgi:competence protein ComEC
MANVARQLLWPTNSEILVRVVFLHVGQGSSAIVLAAHGWTYKAVLVDINLDVKNGGIDVPRLMADLMGKDRLAFANTHPHKDHLRGVVDLEKMVPLGEVWHSGHIPGRDHADAYNDLQQVIRKVKNAGGIEKVLKGSRDSAPFGEAQYYTFAPAKYVDDEIGDEPPEVRYRRIHEQCAVLKFGIGDTWVMIPGDADRDAWENYITYYHKDRLKAAVFAAAHHGSRTFFRYDEKDDPFLDGLKAIAPTYVVISAPTRKESPFDHPHEDAVELYATQVGRTNILHTGEKRHSFICDIFRDGQLHIIPDNGALVETYPIGNDEGGDGGKQRTPAIIISPPLERVDYRPMGGL